jgi:hypothetical protein
VLDGQRGREPPALFEGDRGQLLHHTELAIDHRDQTGAEKLREMSGQAETRLIPLAIRPHEVSSAQASEAECH